MRRLPFWSEAPLLPPVRVPLTRFLRPGVGRPLRVLCLSEAPLCLWTHFAQGKTFPCCDPTEDPVCACGMARRWTAYICALRNGSLAQVGVNLTASGVRYLQAPLPGEPAWRGRAFTLTRCGQSERSPVAVVREPYAEPKAPLPEPADLRAALAILWGGQ